MSYVVAGRPNVDSTTTSGIVVTAGATHVMHARHVLVVVRRTNGSATAVQLPTSPIWYVAYVVKDGKGDASTNNITVSSNNGLIDGQSTAVINTNYGAVTVVFDGSAWSVT